MPLDKYEKIYWRGHLFNRYTAAAIETWEDKLGATARIFQGSFRPYTSYSGSSHMGGGAVDLWFDGIDPHRVTKVGRDVGFAAFWRTPAQGSWPNHQHAILIGDMSASYTAKWQVEQYKMGYNGLSGGARDWQPYRPSPIKPFNYEAWEDDLPLTREEINKIADAVWARKIGNPLSPDPKDEINLAFAINRILLIVNKIEESGNK